MHLAAEREPGAHELLESGAETEREAREALVPGGNVRRTDAARQKRSEAFYFGDDELTREVRVKLVQRDVFERRIRKSERRVEPQR